jgi:MFS family permease
MGNVPSRRWKRIIPIAFLMYTIAYMDRNNMSFGLLGMGKDLGFGATAAGLVGGIFFVGYMFLQVPGSLLAQKWSAKKFITASLVVWSIFSIATGFVHNLTQLLILRFLLGFAEGGVSPATMILLTKWFPLNERARANGYWYLCIPFASIVTAPLSGFLLTFMNWRWMFILEGIPPLIWALIWWFMIDDEPSQARWISSTEKEYIETTLASERQEIKKGTSSIIDALKNRNVVLLFVLFCFLQIGFLGYGLWLPTLVKSLSNGSVMITSLISALPWIAAMIGSIINARYCDKTGKYKWHIAIPIFLAAIFLLTSVLLGESHAVLAIISLILCLGFMYNYAVFWTALSAFIADEVLAVGMGIINAIGNLGGFVGPFIVGYLDSTTHSFFSGEIFLVASLILAGIFAIFLRERKTVGNIKHSNIEVNR